MAPTSVLVLCLACVARGELGSGMPRCDAKAGEKWLGFHF